MGKISTEVYKKVKCILTLTICVIIIGESINYNDINIFAQNNEYVCNENDVSTITSGTSNIMLQDGVISINSEAGYQYIGNGRSNGGIIMSKDSSVTFTKSTGKTVSLINEEDSEILYDRIAQFSPYWIDSYTGPVYNVYCKYAAVIKDEKIGFVDINGTQVKLGDYLWYDNVVSYDQGDKGIYYALYEKTSDTGYYYQLVKEDGTKLYGSNDVKSVEYIHGSGSVSYNKPGRYFAIEKTTGDKVLIDDNGEKWYEGIAWNDICTYSYSLEDIPLILLQVGNDVIYVNCDSGVIKKVTGQLGTKNHKYYTTSDCISVKSDNVLDIYDINMNREITISGNFTDVSRVWDGYVLYDSNKTIKNVCDKYGNLILPENKYDMSLANHYYVLLRDKKTSKQYYLDSTYQLVSIDDIDELVSDYVYSLIGVKPTTSRKTYTNMGIIYNYNVDRISGYLLISKESNYNDIVQLTDNGQCEVYENAIHVLEKIFDNKYILTCVYIFKNNLVDKHLISKEMNLYRSSTSRTTYTDGQKYYKIDEDGDLIESPDWNIKKEETIEKQFGNSGAYYSYIRKTKKVSGVEYEYSDFKMFDDNGKEINTAVSQLYKDDSINDIKLYSDMSEYGYLVFSYQYEKDNTKNKMLYVYNYKGDKVYQCQLSDNSDNTYKIEKRGLLINGNIIMLRNLFPQSINELVTISPYDVINKNDENMIIGINPNVLVEKLKNNFGYVNVSVLDKNNIEKDKKQILVTGDVIKLKDNDNADNTALIAIKGDVDGTGTIDVLDMEAIQKSILGIGDKLSGVYKEAASLTGGDDITVLDMEAVQKDILGIQKIN